MATMDVFSLAKSSVGNSLERAGFKQTMRRLTDGRSCWCQGRRNGFSQKWLFSFPPFCPVAYFSAVGKWGSLASFEPFERITGPCRNATALYAGVKSSENAESNTLQRGAKLFLFTWGQKQVLCQAGRIPWISGQWWLSIDKCLDRGITSTKAIEFLECVLMLFACNLLCQERLMYDLNQWRLVQKQSEADISFSSATHFLKLHSDRRSIMRYRAICHSLQAEWEAAKSSRSKVR